MPTGAGSRPARSPAVQAKARSAPKASEVLEQAADPAVVAARGQHARPAAPAVAAAQHHSLLPDDEAEPRVVLEAEVAHEGEDLGEGVGLGRGPGAAAVARHAHESLLADGDGAALEVRDREQRLLAVDALVAPGATAVRAAQDHAAEPRDQALL